MQALEIIRMRKSLFLSLRKANQPSTLYPTSGQKAKSSPVRGLAKSFQAKKDFLLVA